MHDVPNLQDLESLRPRAILDIIQAASELRFVQDSSSTPAVVPKACSRCGYMTSQVSPAHEPDGTLRCVSDVALKPHNSSVWMSSQKVCKACMLLEGLNRGLPGLGIRRVKQDTAGADEATTQNEPAVVIHALP